MDREAVLAQLESLLPLAVDWVAEVEAQILRDGVPLNEQEMADARAIGVQRPERVRLLRVEEIPFPKQPDLRRAAIAIHFLSPETSAVTLQYGILIRWDQWRGRDLIAHELVHTLQYERMGGIEPFLKEYLNQCLTIGYANSPMELEAHDLATRIQQA